VSPSRAAIFIAVTWVLARPCAAQVRAEVRPASSRSAAFGTLTMAVEVDLGAGGRLLGSYGASLGWDPAALQYQGDTGGDAPFDAAVVNRADVSAGRLSFGDASASGAGGRVNLLNVEFLVTAVPCLTAALDLEITSMFSAVTYEDLRPILQVLDGTTSVTDLAFNLRIVDPDLMLFEWDPIPGAVSYDVIRGERSALLDDGTAVRLGDVLCIEDDSMDATTAAGAEPPSPDTETPPLGQAFLYFVRFFDGVGNSTYGFTDLCARERIAGSGDCP